MNEYNHHKVIKHAIWNSLESPKDNKDNEQFIMNKILCTYSSCDSCTINDLCIAKNEIDILCKASDFADSMNIEALFENLNLFGIIKTGSKELFTSNYFPFNIHYNITRSKNEITLTRVNIGSESHIKDMASCDTIFDLKTQKTEFYSLIHGFSDPSKDNRFLINQKDNVAFLHAMSEEGEKDSLDKFKMHLERCFNEYLFTRDENIALTMLGVALHSIMDSFTPSHTKFQWYGEQDMGLHAQGDVIPFINYNTFQFKDKIYFMDEKGFCKGVYERDEKKNMKLNQDESILKHINRNQYNQSAGNELYKTSVLNIITPTYKDENLIEWTKLPNSLSGIGYHKPSGDIIIEGKKYEAFKLIAKDPKNPNASFETIRYVPIDEWEKNDWKMGGFNLTNENIEKLKLPVEYYEYVGTYNFEDNSYGVLNYFDHKKEDIKLHEQGYNFYTQPNRHSSPRQQIVFEPGQFMEEKSIVREVIRNVKGYGNRTEKWNIKTRELDMLLIFLRVFDINNDIDFNDPEKDKKLLEFLGLNIDDYHIVDNRGNLSAIKNYSIGNATVAWANYNPFSSKENLYLNDINEALQKKKMGKNAYIFSDYAINTVKDVYNILSFCKKEYCSTYDHYKKNKNMVIGNAIAAWEQAYNEFIKIHRIQKAIDPALYRNKEQMAGTGGGGR